MSAVGALGETAATVALYAASREILSLSAWGRAEYDQWAPLLQRLQIAPHTTATLLARAEVGGRCLLDELLASGLVNEETLYREVAKRLAIPYRSDLSPIELIATSEEAMTMLRARRAPLVQAVGTDGFIVYVAAPRPADCLALKRWLAEAPGVLGRLSLARPAVLRGALIGLARPRLVEKARDGLFVAHPEFSARLVTNGWQGALVGAIGVGTPVGLTLWPALAFLVLHLTSTLFFMGCVSLRVAALVLPVPRHGFDPAAVDRSQLPVYTVLIALRDEVDVVPELLASIGRLEWPRGKLEVKFVCEDDDRRTIDALRAHGLRPWAEIVEVPRGMPGTKPNALSFALKLSRGDLVAVYDAEDRPHPHQLLEAWARFSREDDRLACVQAPLEIDNGAAGLIPRMFALEYAALFRRLLPFLASRGYFLPLGGTSNHFRRAALEDVGAWDPYNVTEDADLGLRFARFGYRTGVIDLPTGEDAPERPMVWLKQRTRWMKGWGQTWLVHMRDPVRLLRDVGAKSFVGVQILMAGVLISSLLHPLMLLTAVGFAAAAVADVALSPLQFFLFALDAFNIVVGYGAFLLLGWRASRPAERRGFWKLVIATPLYWMGMSVAAWRAVFQLWSDPHHWEKTPHARHRRDAADPHQSPRKPGPSPMIFASSSPTTTMSRPS